MNGKRSSIPGVKLDGGSVPKDGYQNLSSSGSKILADFPHFFLPGLAAVAADGGGSNPKIAVNRASSSKYTQFTLWRIIEMLFVVLFALRG